MTTPPHWPRISQCRQCDEDIIWIADMGRWQPINPTPTPEGRWIRIRHLQRFHRLVGLQREQAQTWGWNLYTEHTCNSPARRVEGVQS